MTAGECEWQNVLVENIPEDWTVIAFIDTSNHYSEVEVVQLSHADPDSVLEAVAQQEECSCVIYPRIISVMLR